MPNQLISFGTRLKKYRETNNLTQGHLARIAGITQTQVSHYENGSHLPNLETCWALANALGVSISMLVGEDKIRFAPPRRPTREELALFVLEAIEVPHDVMARIRLIIGPFDTP